MMAEFFNMGGYGAFIWPCYVLGMGFVIALYWHSAVKLKQSQSEDTKKG